MWRWMSVKKKMEFKERWTFREIKHKMTFISHCGIHLMQTEIFPTGFLYFYFHSQDENKLGQTGQVLCHEAKFLEPLRNFMYVFNHSLETGSQYVTFAGLQLTEAHRFLPPGSWKRRHPTSPLYFVIL